MAHLADRNLRRHGALRRAWRDDGGFSLLELILICVIAGTMMAIAILGLGSSVSAARSRGAIAQVKLQLQNAREQAISQQRDIKVEFVGSDMIRLTRVNRPVAAGTTLLSEARLEGAMTFQKLVGAPETPDAWGGNNAVAFGTATGLFFRSGDGALVDQTGNFVNGRVFLGHVGGKRETFGVVSVFGPTGRVRSYRLTGETWNNY
jgi:Tfp pilus assembly protein FimT